MYDKVANIHNITVSTTLTNTGMFTKQLNLKFVPDEMIVKLINYQNVGVAETGVFSINCNHGIGDIGSARDGSTVAPRLRFDMNGITVNDLWTFTVKTPAGAIDTARLGMLFIHLEFVKYLK